MGSFSIPLSGLLASQEDLAIVSNNLANLNTTGFKGSNANFSDLIYQQLGSDGAGNPIQSGMGTAIGSSSVNFSEGSVTSTGVDSNVAIEGNGFLQVQNNGLTLYTRNGDLSLSSTGFLETPDGSEVMGFPAVNGSVSANGATVPLQVKIGQATPPQATANVSIAVSLDATAPAYVSPASQQTGTGIGSSTTLKTGVTLAFTDGTNKFSYTTKSGDTLTEVANAINAGGKYTATLSGNSLEITASSGTTVSFSTNTLTDAAGAGLSESFAASGTNATSTSFATPVTVYDSLGNSHVLNFNFTKTGANQWSYSITMPAADVTGSPQPTSPVALNLGSGTTGTLTFSSAGVLTSPATDVLGITLPSGLTLTDGAKNLTFNWNVLNASGSPVVTQVAGTSTASGTLQDGFAAGSLQGFTIQQDGTLEGSFTNGQVSVLGQIALAMFPNQEGLLQTGNSNFVATTGSGLPSIGVAGTGGRGTLQGGSLEGSNVDISTEFSDLILAQNTYQANARAFDVESTIFSQSTLTLGQ